MNIEDVIRHTSPAPIIFAVFAKMCMVWRCDGRQHLRFSPILESLSHRSLRSTSIFQELQSPYSVDWYQLISSLCRYQSLPWTEKSPKRNLTNHFWYMRSCILVIHCTYLSTNSRRVFAFFNIKTHNMLKMLVMLVIHLSNENTQNTTNLYVFF